MGLVLVHNIHELTAQQKMLARAVRAPRVVLADDQGRRRRRSWRYPGADQVFTA